ncbi:MAG TPA: [protein-PII] uridylyltransferase [Candidatus Nanopelagicaceae bacterium]|nr:[protein-PII] uridylyltransferase [Candidatus Nanopelagicaceae bacterium]
MATTRSDRLTRSDEADAQLIALVDAANRLHPGPVRWAVFAVGGYGRRELCPGSDLDLLFLHDVGDGRKLKSIVDAVLYPLWDSGRAIDHSVRTKDQTLSLAKTDVKVSLGLLDARFVAGDETLGADLPATATQLWRGNARHMLEELRVMQQDRVKRNGELAYLIEPDVKEARGGLRDITALRAIAASWVADLPHAKIEESNEFLLDVREMIHLVTGRKKDVLLLQEQDEIARRLGLSDADELLRRVAEAGRTVDYASDLTWRRVEQGQRETKRSLLSRRRPPVAEQVAQDLVIFEGEIALEFAANVESDEFLTLRAGATAAQLGVPLSPITCARLAQSAPPLPTPWAERARDLFISMIGAGDSTLDVWEALDQAGVIVRLIPEWQVVRNLPQRNVLHRHTVDRHLLETVVQAAALTRTVRRPDLLLVAALFHDIGKGTPGDHSIVGAELVKTIATRMGFPREDIATLESLVLNHLLLPDTATRRDVEDPQTIANVIATLGEQVRSIDLLHALTIADGLATAGTAWGPWKAKLVEQLVSRINLTIAGIPHPTEPDLDETLVSLSTGTELYLRVKPVDDHYEILVVAPDSPGLLANVAGVLSLGKLDVRAAKTLTKNESAVMIWHVTVAPYGQVPDEAMLLELLRRVLKGEVDVTKRLQDRARDHARPSGLPTPPPVVEFVQVPSSHATLLEVRSHDRPGLLHDVGVAVTKSGVDVHAAIVSTLGAEACDVFYITALGGAPMSAVEGERVALAVEAELRQLALEVAAAR